jgi:hypothetical protein
MPETSAASQPSRELAHRLSDGIEVVLVWHAPTDELTVCVTDERTGAYFEIAADPASALDVFEHPYAYAAFAGLPYEDVLLPNWVAASAAPAPSLADVA